MLKGKKSMLRDKFEYIHNKNLSKIDADKKINEMVEERSEIEISNKNILDTITLIISFFTFLYAIYLILINDLKWGASLLIISFIFGIYSVYESLKDNSETFRRLNIILKIILFTFEFVALTVVLKMIIG